MGTYGLVRKRDDNKIRLASENIGLKVEVDIDDLKYKKEDDWANYPKGVLYFMKKKAIGFGNGYIGVGGKYT